jgi:hypothetical protein
MVELLVALVLLSIVSTALYRVLVSNQRIYQAQTQRIDMQQNIRAAGQILPADLRELDASEGDISAASSTSITFRAMRWMGVICSAPITGPLPAVTNPVLVFTVMDQKLMGERAPVVGDSVLLRYEGDEGTSADDGWVPGVITAMLAQNCPAGLPYNGTAGLRITATASMLQVAAPPQLATPNVVNAIYGGAPVRGFITQIYSLYRPAGDTSWYVGLTRGVNAIQPVVGPVLSNGLQFTFLNDTNNVVLNPALANDRVRIGSVLFTLRARTAQVVRNAATAAGSAAVIDSVTVRVSLRNNRRW